MEHIKKYWLIYLVIAIIIIIYFYNRNKVNVTPIGSGPPLGSSRSSAPVISLSDIPTSRFNSLTAPEQQIVSGFFNSVNSSRGVSDQMINSVNSQLSSIGSGVNFFKNDSTAKAKCKEGQDCWSINLIIFTMCRCKKYDVVPSSGSN